MLPDHYVFNVLLWFGLLAFALFCLRPSKKVNPRGWSMLLLGVLVLCACLHAA